MDIKINSSEDKKIEYKIPPLSLLKGSRVKETESEQTLKQRAKKIEATLKSFGVGAKVVRINKGPTVTCFELQPDMGVKVNKIVNLAKFTAALKGNGDFIYQKFNPKPKTQNR